MKTKDKLAQRIQSTGIAIAVVLAGAALFMSSIGPATAATEDHTQFEFPDELTQEDINNLNTSTATGGRYMMQFEALYHIENNNIYFYNVVWDTETGRSKMYYGSTKKGKIVAVGDPYNLPASPL